MSVDVSRDLDVFDAGFLEDRHRLADAFDPSIIILIQTIGDHSAQSRLSDCNRAVDTGTEGGVDRAADRCHTVSRTLDDGVEFGMHDEVVFDRPLKSLGRVFHATWESVESRGDDLVVLTHDDRADATTWILAP